MLRSGEIHVLNTSGDSAKKKYRIFNPAKNGIITTQLLSEKLFFFVKLRKNKHELQRTYISY